MKLSPSGVLEIAEHEGLVLGPYLDSVNVWTDGVGHTAAAGGPDPKAARKVDTRGWSDAQVRQQMLVALRQFDTDLDSYEARVNRAVKVPLKQHQFDALVSFDFNTGGILRAKLTEAINRGDMSGEGFMGWLKPKEIIKRRRAEQALFRTGKHDANGDMIPVYDALGNGKTRYRTAISGRDLAALMAQSGASHAAPVPHEAVILATSPAAPLSPKPVADSPAPKTAAKPWWLAWIINLLKGIK